MRATDAGTARPFHLLHWSKLLLIMAAIALAVWAGFWWKEKRAHRAAEREAAFKRHETAYYRIIGLAGAAYAYSYDHHGYLPSADNWEEALRPYYKETGEVEEFSKQVVSPLLPGPRRFAMNKALSGRKIRDITSDESRGAILFFDSVAPGPSAADYLTSLPAPSADGEIVVICLDQHPRFFRGPQCEHWPPGGPPVSYLPTAIQQSHQIEKTIAARK